MKALIIAGFLGSGKTTLLLRIARSLASPSTRIAIIENEIGEVGVDGDYLELEGLKVQELFGGCVCCTLSAGLLEALAVLRRQYRPDIVILEATGVADPGDVVATVRRFGEGVDGITVITVVDAARYGMLMEIMTPLVTSQILAADIVAVSKTDMAGPETAEQVLREVGVLNPRAHVAAVSAEGYADLDAVMDRLRC